MGGNEEPIGTVVDYIPDTDAAKLHLESGPLSVGDTVHIRGTESEVEERIEVLQLPSGPTDEAHAGDDVGVKVCAPVEEGAKVFRVTDPYDDESASILDKVFEA